MASYSCFEELPVWQQATDLAAEIFALTSREAFRFRGDLVNQIRRAVLSVSNNIAEGFERGTTSDLINFLYIARGSCGETRSMLRFAPKLGGMDAEREGIDAAAARCESVSRQLYGWIDALKNTTIEGQRKLNDAARVAQVKEAAQEKFRERFNSAAEEAALREGRHGAYLREKFDALWAMDDAVKGALTKGNAPECPVCGGKMVKRHDRYGKAFWGCADYPRCRGSRPYGGVGQQEPRGRS